MRIQRKKMIAAQSPSIPCTFEPTGYHFGPRPNNQQWSNVRRCQESSTKKQVQIQGCSSSRSGRWQWVFWCSAKPCHKHLNLFTGLCGPGASKTFNEGSSCIPATTHPIQHSPLVFAVFCENTCDKHKKRAFANVDGGNSFPACPDQILCQLGLTAQMTVVVTIQKENTYVGMCLPLVNIKIAGKWMFIIDP